MRRHRVAGAVGVVLLLALTGCSSSSKKAGGTPTSGAPASGGSASATNAPATGTPIKIGQFTPTNAPFYNTPDALAAVKAAIATINASGGVKGHPLVLDYCNDENDPNVAIACARQLVSDGVVATVSSITIASNDTVAGILTAANIPNINLYALSPTEFNAANNFPYDGQAAWEYAGASGAAVKIGGAKKVIVVYPNNQGLQPMLDLIHQAITKTGADWLGQIVLPLTPISDYTPYAEQIIKSGADTAILPLTEAQSIGIIKAARQLGSSVKFASSSSTYSDSDLAAMGADADGIIVFSSLPWIHDGADYPGVNAFVTSMKAEQARGDKDADVTKARPTSMSAWATVFSLKQAMESIPTGTPITAKAVLDAMTSATSLDMQGTAATTWNPSVHQTAIPNFTRVSNTFGYLLKVDNGQQVLAQKAPVDVLQYLQ